ncbi:MAG: hypothetical protein AMXMBFR13_13020 [Phycisphaerae bacterium]
MVEHIGTEIQPAWPLQRPILVDADLTEIGRIAKFGIKARSIGEQTEVQYALRAITKDDLYLQTF